MTRCLCGALDCPMCHPENFIKVDGKPTYIGDSEVTEEQIDDFIYNKDPDNDCPDFCERPF